MDITELRKLLLLLQTGDSFFPTGAYAHSLGLEELVRMGVVHDAETLSDFLRRQMLPALEHFDLPYLRFAHEAAASGDVEALCQIDLEFGALKLPRELREASVQLGGRRLRMQLKVYPNELTKRFEQCCGQGEARGHHVVAYAIQAASAPLDAVLAAWVYLAVSGTCAAALKLVRIGQDACQRLIAECMSEAPDLIKRSLHIVRQDAGWFNPVLEIAAMRHERAFERLFIS